VTVTTAEAWDLWREACCLERGGHFWEAGYLARPCKCCSAVSRVCYVCENWYRAPGDRQRCCSDACREFACKYKYVQPPRLRQLWKQEQWRTKPCPSGKIRHQAKRAAEKAAKRQVRLRYSAFPRWLNVYECDMCGGWHLTSKPQARRQNKALGAA
jgi:hypothetical protein